MFPQVLRMTLSKGSIPSPSRQPPYSAGTPDLRPNLSVLVAWDNRDTAHLAADYLENRGHPNRTPRWTNRAACMGRPPAVPRWRARRWNRKASLSSRNYEPMRRIRCRAHSLEGYRRADAPWPACGSSVEEILK